MSRITGWEEIHQVPPKVRSMYTAVLQFIEEGADVANIPVSSITERAGIGKGTAYEYFDTKEEIVVCGIMYHVQQVFGWLEQEMLQRHSFREQLDFLLDEMSKKDGRKYCFLRFVHFMTDNSEFSKMIRERMQAEAFAPYRPMYIFEKILSEALAQGELKTELPMEYMIYTTFSHLMTYMMTITAEEDIKLPEEQMRGLVRQGILRELGAEV